ncbi:mannose-1-phosphate guanyltransferase [Pneumocystis murina B123]|uniref:mannose-1-phosphate guanylyltransferase n=1 Tax=Pneumocystis murina (strain B123) TaxID=1069680 RepID=M7NMN4_PNEMU|nr:mannose-1-phosphate guanyltransferase [Pneumocystis murina B123]EMR09943.1 mannose-1-phosphate guanyltransferase [Pneumocystis murina B123]
MKALILVGGFGTRLRPLTLTLPKPLIEFGNRPMILHQIEALVSSGVTDIVLAVNYCSDIMVSTLKQYEQQYHIKIVFSVENEPLGTAGPLALARDILEKDHSPFFVLNSDVICEFAFSDFLHFHKQHGAEGTIIVTKVEEPSKYGVIVMKPASSEIERFVEKPAEFVSNKINAGIYVFNPSVLKRIPLRPTSIEKEIFPAMANEGQLHSYDLEGYWMDIGQPKDYLTGTCLYLSSLAKNKPSYLDHTSSYIYRGNVIIHPSAKIGINCRIGPNVVIGPDCTVGDGVRLQRCVIFQGSRIQNYAWIECSIIGWNSTVGKWARLENVTVLGEDVTIKDEIYVNGGSILPHKCIDQNIEVPSIIM